MSEKSRRGSDLSHLLVEDDAVQALPGEETVEESDVGRLSDLAHQRLRDALFEGRLKGGTTVSQADLVKLVDVPIGPLRDALRVLQAEGLVTIHSRSGIEICKPDLQMLRNTYQMRMFLELPAVRRFAESAPMAEIESMIAAHEKAIALIEGRDFLEAEATAAEDFDRRFHLRIIRSLANALVEGAYMQAQDLNRLYRMDTKYRYSTVLAVRTFREHLAILEPMRERGADAAEAALQAHFTKAMQRAMGFI